MNPFKICHIVTIVLLHAPFLLQANFIPNKGQIHNINGGPSEALYVLPLKGMNVFLYEDRMAYEVHGHPIDIEWSEDLRSIPITINRVEVLFKGASADCSLIPFQELGHPQRFIGPGVDVSVNSFAQVVYRNLYDGIDLIMKINSTGSFEYDFIVEQYADLSQIQLEYIGQQSIEKCGTQLCLDLGGVELRESIPRSYYASNEALVDIEYLLDDNHVSFKGDVTDTRQDRLIIDPTPELVYASFYGGESGDFVQGSCSDLDGNLYSIGSTFSTTNISTEGSYQSEHILIRDGVITKWSGSGEAIWSTYWGGEGYEEMIDIEFFGGSLFILGITDSEGMATTGAFQEELGDGLFTSVLGRFDAENGFLGWSTLYSESNVFFWNLYDIAINGNGDIISVGTSTQSELPVNNNPLQAELKGTEDGLIIVWNNDGVPIYSTHLRGEVWEGGGNELERFKKVLVTSEGTIIIGGDTKTIDFPLTNDANQTAPEGESEIVLVVLNSDLQLQYSSYFGTSDSDGLLLLHYDEASSKLFLAGSGNSEILTPDAYLTSSASPYIFAILDENFILDYATFIAGTPQSVEWTGGNIFISGVTIYEEGVSTEDAWRADIATNGAQAQPQDIFIQQYTEFGQLVWGTYFGECASDFGGYLEYSGDQYYLFGSSESTSELNPSCELPFVTADAEQTENNGGQDMFIAIFDNATGIPELQNDSASESFRMYPNPLSSNQTLNIYHDFDYSHNAQFQLLGSDGSLVASIPAGYRGSTTSINLPELASGIYLLQLKQDGVVVQSEKLVIVN